MLHVFEVLLSGIGPEDVLSEDVIKETGAQVMTEAEVEQLGFQGIRPDPHGRPRCFIAVHERDSRFITSRLDMHEGVDGFQIHHVED